MNKWEKIKKKDLKSLGEAPQEASENIQAPELAPRDNRFTGRTKRIAFTARPEFYEELRKMAFEQNCYQIEILEKAMEVYKKSLFSGITNKNPKINEDKTPEFCSFRTENNQEPCSHFIFDTKKQLCLSHNKQVWNKFHEFLKDKSVSTAAAWYEAWNQSRDWKHFWDLAEEKMNE